MAQRLACWPCNSRVYGSVLRTASVSDETISRGSVSMISLLVGH